MRPRIGISSCLFHADKGRPVFNGRPLLYVEQSMPHYLMSLGAIAYALPTVSPVGPVTYGDLLAGVDALVLHGGVDMAPGSYGEQPLKDAWQGDGLRDAYEIALFRAARAQNKPVLGICRGAQVINVACGGSLYQDISTQKPGSLVHRDAELYEKNTHAVTFVEGGELASLYDAAGGMINSVHHQGVKVLGDGLRTEAYSSVDGVVEAFVATEGSWCMGVQWHPEFQTAAQPELLDPTLLLRFFLASLASKC